MRTSPNRLLIIGGTLSAFAAALVIAAVLAPPSMTVNRRLSDKAVRRAIAAPGSKFGSTLEQWQLQGRLSWYI